MPDNENSDSYGYFRDQSGTDYRTGTGQPPSHGQTVYLPDNSTGTFYSGYVTPEK